MLPGYMKLNYEQDLRIDKPIAQGGQSIISVGVILNMEVKKRIRIVHDSVVVKQALDKSNITKEDSLAQFHQEVAVMG